MANGVAKSPLFRRQAAEMRAKSEGLPRGNAPHEAGNAAAPATPSAPAPRWHAFAQLALVGLIFGTSWPVLKNGIEAGATPLWFTAARACCGTLGGFALVGALGLLRWPRRRDRPIILSVGILQLAAFFTLTNLALRYIPAGRSAVLAYTTTLWLVPLEALTGGERLDLPRSLGLLAGLGGVAVLLNPLALDWSQPDVLISHVLLLLAALGWAIAIFHARRHAWDGFSPLQALPWQMLVASLAVIVLAAIAEPAGRLPAVPAVTFALIYVGLFGGPVATWAATSVARDLPTLVSSLGFLGVPVVGVIVSTLWLGEPLTPPLLVGAALIFLGLVVVALANDRLAQQESV
jgi:drug/metabolite transporter (DMT)-like permease